MLLGLGEKRGGSSRPRGPALHFDPFDRIRGAVIALRESFPRQVDKKSRGPQGEGSGILKEEERTNFFFLLYLGLYNNNVLCLRTVSGLNLLANSVNYGSRPALYKDYITTMYST